MNEQEILKKAENGEQLTVDEVIVYENYIKTIKPTEHIYGKYGTLAKKYLEEHNPAKLWTIENIPEYLHGIDKAAERLYESMYAKLSALPKYKKNGDFLYNLRVETEIQELIEEEILNEIVYVN